MLLNSTHPVVHDGAVMVLIFFVLFQIKHMVIDFFLQNRFPYMWQNKHKFFHPGGWLHAGSHAVPSFGILALAHFPTVGGFPWWQAALLLCGAELLIHFSIDLVKMRIGIWKDWYCNTSPHFWDLLGIDQFLHQLTYAGMILLWIA